MLKCSFLLRSTNCTINVIEKNYRENFIIQFLPVVINTMNTCVSSYGVRFNDNFFYVTCDRYLSITDYYDDEQVMHKCILNFSIF